MSTSTCMHRSRTSTSTCTTSTTSMRTALRGAAKSRIPTCTAIRARATGIRTIRTCTTGTSTEGHHQALVRREHPELFEVELAVAVAIRKVEGARHVVAAAGLLTRDVAVAVRIEIAERAHHVAGDAAR